MIFFDSEYAQHFFFQLDDFLRAHFLERKKKMSPRAQELARAVEYSLFSGGKRFRPLVCALTAQSLELGLERVLPWAAAVECVHTYSRIHDDLPCMDDDNFRRGQPTSHRMFGESTALLAGDALLTEAYMIISQHYSSIPEIAIQLTALISDSAGFTGMIAGQVEDLSMAQMSDQKSLNSANLLDESELLNMHNKKTGRLIEASAVGVSFLARADEKTKNIIERFSKQLGLAFQLADDILDFDPKNLEYSGLPKHIGLEATKQKLKQATQVALSEIEVLGPKANGLRELIKCNLTRDL